jgi:hypothetical protein
MMALILFGIKLQKLISLNSLVLFFFLDDRDGQFGRLHFRETFVNLAFRNTCFGQI